MKTLAPVLVALLKTNATILSNTNNGNRITPWARLSTHALPAITFAAGSGLDTYNVANMTPGSGGLLRRTVQIDVWASTYALAWDLALAARQTLNGYVGGTGGAYSAWNITEEQDSPEGPSNDSNSPIYRVTQEYDVHYKEPAAAGQGQGT